MPRRLFVLVAALAIAACAKFTGEDNASPDAQAPGSDASVETGAEAGADGASPPSMDGGDGGAPTPLLPFVCPQSPSIVCDEFERDAPASPSYSTQGNVGFKISLSTSANMPRTKEKSFLSEVEADNEVGGFHYLRYVPSTTAGATSFEMRFALRAPKLPDGRIDLVAVDFPTGGAEQTLGVRLQGNTIMLVRYTRSGAAVQPLAASKPFVFGAWHDYTLRVGTNRAVLSEPGNDLPLDFGNAFTVLPAALRIDVGISWAATQSKGFSVFMDDLVMPK